MQPEPFATELALRCWPVQEGQPAQKKTQPGKKRGWVGRSSRVGERVLVLDCETTTDEFHSLRLGFFRVYGDMLESEGVFVADGLAQSDPADFEIIRAFAEKRELPLMTRAEFVREVFYPEAWRLGTLVIGFNLPFDLARLAHHAGACRGEDRDSFSLKLSDSLYHGRIRVKPFSTHAASFEFTRGKKSKFGSRRKFSGRFLDLHTLAFALSGKSHTLGSAGEAFRAEVLKESVEEDDHGGPITDAYLGYARRDVAATYSLYLALLGHYENLPFATDAPEAEQNATDTPITALYSGASIAKAYLRKMGVPGFRKVLAKVPPEYLGYAMAAFYGGRAECRIRHRLLPAALLDFSSQYPAVFTLLNLMPQVTARRLATQEQEGQAVAALLGSIAADPSLLFDPSNWPDLAGFAEVKPEGDFLPSRAPWGMGESGNRAKVMQAVAPLTANQPLWYALPDLAASAALTGRVPKALRAFRAVPEGRLSLKPLKLGEATLDPKRPDFFARVVGERKRLEGRGDHAAAMGAKALANSGCYGIFVEFNPQHLKDKEQRRWVTLYSTETKRKAFGEKVEVPGSYANPLVGPLVTAGGRLLLALLQREVEGRRGAFLWTATDAMAVVTGDGESVEGLPGIRSLPDDEVRAIQDRFAALSPYGEGVKQFLKLEAEGVAYAISSNRYCLKMADGRLLTDEGHEDDGEEDWLRTSRHGMSGIISTAGSLQDFARHVWSAVLTDKLPAGWSDQLLRRKFPIRKPSTWNLVNKAKLGISYDRSIKPFGFLQTAISWRSGLRRTGDEGRSYYGPFTRDGATALKRRFWDPRTGERVEISVRQPDADIKPDGPSQIYCSTLADFVLEFKAHPEVKMVPADGSRSRPLTAGLFVPQPVHCHRTYLIGKETNRLSTDVAAEVGEGGVSVIVANGRTVMTPALIGDIRRIDEAFGLNAAAELGISEDHWRLILAGKRGPSQHVARKVRELARPTPQSTTGDNMNEHDTAQLLAFQAAISAGSFPRPMFKGKRAAAAACQWANEHLGETAYTVRWAKQGKAYLRQLCANGEFIQRRRVAQAAEHEAAQIRQAAKTQERQQAAEAERLQEQEQARADIRKLAHWPKAGVASLLGVSKQHWQWIRTARRGPSPQLATLIRHLARLLPETPPTGHEAQAATLVEAARKIGSTPSQKERSTMNHNNTKDAQPSSATLLVALISDLKIEPFRTPGGEAWCRVPINGHHETHPLESEWLRDYLAHSFYRHHQRVMPAKTLTDVLPILKHQALNGTDEREVCVRVGGSIREKVYIDLANEAWEAIEIDGEGWRIVSHPPIPFFRPAGMLPLRRPMPGSIDLLRPLLNYGTEENFRLLVAFLLAALCPSGPYPVLSLQGSQGSGKSDGAEYIVGLIDPQRPPLREILSSDRAYNPFVAAKSAWLQAYDNVSVMPNSLSDDFCRLATGGGKVKRALYTDDDERRYEAARPVVFTSIPNIIHRPDLRERTMIVAMTKPERVIEKEALKQQFERDAGCILGALCAAVSTAIGNLDSVTLPELPRLADFARWVEAASPAFGWEPGEFCALLKASQEEATLEAVCEDPFAQVLVEFLKGQPNRSWQGAARELLEIANDHAGETTRHGKRWPRQAAEVTNWLKRMGPELKLRGLAIARDGRTNQGVCYTLTLTGDDSADSGAEPGAEGEGPEPARTQRHRCGKCTEQFPECLLTRFEFSGGSVTRACAECRDDTRAWVLEKDGDAIETPCAGCEQPKVKGVIVI